MHIMPPQSKKVKRANNSRINGRFASKIELEGYENSSNSDSDSDDSDTESEVEVDIECNKRTNRYRGDSVRTEFRKKEKEKLQDASTCKKITDYMRLSTLQDLHSLRFHKNRLELKEKNIFTAIQLKERIKSLDLICQIHHNQKQHKKDNLTIYDFTQAVVVRGLYLSLLDGKKIVEASQDLAAAHYQKFGDSYRAKTIRKWAKYYYKQGNFEDFFGGKL